MHRNPDKVKKTKKTRQTWRNQGQPLKSKTKLWKPNPTFENPDHTEQSRRLICGNSEISHINQRQCIETKRNS